MSLAEFTEDLLMLADIAATVFLETLKKVKGRFQTLSCLLDFGCRLGLGESAWLMYF